MQFRLENVHAIHRQTHSSGIDEFIQVSWLHQYVLVSYGIFRHVVVSREFVLIQCSKTTSSTSASWFIDVGQQHGYRRLLVSLSEQTHDKRNPVKNSL